VCVLDFRDFRVEEARSAGARLKLACRDAVHPTSPRRINDHARGFFDEVNFHVELGKYERGRLLEQ